MELAKALKQALKFVNKKAENPAHTCVRFLPAHGDESDPGYTPARVMSTDGEVTVVIDVDEDLPNALYPCAKLDAPAKAKLRTMQLVDQGAIMLGADGDRHLLGQSLAVEGYPGIPPIPETYWMLDWSGVLWAVHAAALPKDVDLEPEYHGVHVCAGLVEATNKHRLVRIAVDVPAESWGGPAHSVIIPTAALKHWRAGNVTVAFTHTHAFFRNGAELRITQLKPGIYPDYSAKFEPHTGSWMALSASTLLALSKQAVGFSDTKTLSLSFSDTGLELGAWNASDQQAFGGRIDAEMYTPTYLPRSPSTVLVSGKYLIDALKIVKTPQVRVCFGGALDPIRLESGPTVELVYPVFEEATT